MTVFLSIVLFGVLVFIHELGHFLVAKFSGVYVERFALGFGPTLFRKTRGETEYAICALPLGGYVKMRGEEPTEEGAAQDPRSFAAKPVRTRLAIVMMGPLSNLILPVIVFSGLYMVGMPTPVAEVGTVIPGYPAEKAGLRAGDRIVAIEDRPVWKWSEMTEAFRDRPEQSTKLKVLRKGESLEVSLVPVKELEPNVYGEIRPVGKIGIDLQPFQPVVGVSDPSSFAAKAGLKTGDIVTSVDGKPVKHWWEVEAFFPGGPSHARKLGFKRTEGEKEVPIEVEFPASIRTLLESGLAPGELFIREVRPGTVAEEKGLKAGDRLVALNGRELSGWYSFQTAIQQNRGENITLDVLRQGKKVTLDLAPREVEHKDEVTQEKKKIRQLGIVSFAVPAMPTMGKDQYLNPFHAIAHGFKETVNISVGTFYGIVKLVRGDLPLNTLGGPISIFYLAGTSYKAGGWLNFFKILAVLSISLGVLNFLPIPVLDGGHILFFLIEAIKGSPVSLRVREVANQIGFVLILGLMALVFYVDINRYFLDRIRALFN